MKREITAETETEIKSPPYQKSQEKEFERAAARMIDIISERFKNQAIKQMNQTTIDKFADAQVGNYAKVFLALAKRVSRKMVKQFDDDRIEELTSTVLGKVNKANRKDLYGKVEKRIGISSAELYKTEGLKPTINALELETAQWMKRLRDDTLEFYTANTLRVMSQGGSIEDVLAELSDVEGKRKDHAKFTARNQIANFNSMLTKTRAQNLGIEKAKWVTAGDERVRPCHNVRNGKEFDLKVGLYSSCDGKTLLPGVDYQCFIGSTKLNHTSLCRKVFRRVYSGELHELVFDDGVVVSSTPNHPIFTVDGFKPARLINEGDYIVRAVDQGVNAVEFNGNDMIPTLEQIFGALELLGVDGSVTPTISGEFHGDISDGEIDIVCLDSLLTDELNTSVSEKFSELNLPEPDKMVILDHFTCGGDFSFGLDTSNRASGSLMSSLDLFMSGFVAHLRPLELFCFTLGSWIDAAFGEPLSDNTPADVKVFGDKIFAFSALVHGYDFIDWQADSIRAASVSGRFKPNLRKLPREGGAANADFGSGFINEGTVKYQFSRVSNKRVVDFSGHVYNLETISNDYIANTAAVSNCRCTYELIIPEFE